MIYHLNESENKLIPGKSITMDIILSCSTRVSQRTIPQVDCIERKSLLQVIVRLNHVGFMHRIAQWVPLFCAGADRITAQGAGGTRAGWVQQQKTNERGTGCSETKHLNETLQRKSVVDGERRQLLGKVVAGDEGITLHKRCYNLLVNINTYIFMLHRTHLHKKRDANIKLSGYSLLN